MKASICNGYIIIDNMYDERHVIPLAQLVRAARMVNPARIPLIYYAGGRAVDVKIASNFYEQRMKIFEGEAVPRPEEKCFEVSLPKNGTKKGLGGYGGRYVIDLNAMELSIDDTNKIYRMEIHLESELFDLVQFFAEEDDELPEMQE